MLTRAYPTFAKAVPSIFPSGNHLLRFPVPIPGLTDKFGLPAQWPRRLKKAAADGRRWQIVVCPLRFAILPQAVIDVAEAKVVFLQAALNGDRQHDAVPKSSEAMGVDAEASAKAGAHSVHVHAYDEIGRETLNAAGCGAAVRAIRARCPGVPISLTTSATIVPDPIKRLAVVKSWIDLPDLVTANQGEAGIVELSEWLLSRGVEIEAGLLSAADARKFVASALRDRCRRVLIEPLNPDPAIALQDAAEMEAILSAGGITLPQVHHGYDGSCWAVNERALARRHGIRTGLEDVAVLPDGSPVTSNAQLVEAARALIESTDVRA